MSASPYNSILRSGLLRRLWLIVALAMAIPVALLYATHLLAEAERTAEQQGRQLMALSRERAATLLFNQQIVPPDFARGLGDQYLVVLDRTGTARFSNTAIPEELVQLFHRRACRVMASIVKSASVFGLSV